MQLLGVFLWKAHVPHWWLRSWGPGWHKRTVMAQARSLSPAAVNNIILSGAASTDCLQPDTSTSQVHHVLCMAMKCISNDAGVHRGRVCARRSVGGGRQSGRSHQGQNQGGAGQHICCSGLWSSACSRSNQFVMPVLL